MQCGSRSSTSDDCESEYRNALDRNDLDQFCDRCREETGSDPLCDRCDRCCDVCSDATTTEMPSNDEFKTTTPGPDSRAVTEPVNNEDDDDLPEMSDKNEENKSTSYLTSPIGMTIACGAFIVILASAVVTFMRCRRSKVEKEKSERRKDVTTDDGDAQGGPSNPALPVRVANCIAV